METISKIFNGKYTISSRKTGEHRTFMIRTQASDATFAPGQRVIALLAGPDNESDYRAFGFVTDDGVQVWRSKRSAEQGQRSAWEVYAEMVWSLALDAGFSRYAELGYSLLVEGRCYRCNRTLTTPESILTGIGPVCAGRSTDVEAA